MEVQTRSEENGIGRFESLEAAFKHAETDHTVWKVSFNAEDGSRCRLVRSPVSAPYEPSWVFDPLLPEEVTATLTLPPGG